MTHPIELAYRAHRYIPTADYRHGRRRKMYNPIRTTPALVQAMVHVGPAMGLRVAQERARKAVAEPDAARYIQTLGWDALLTFLDTIAVFLKASPQSRKEKGMRTFEPQSAKERLDNQAISEKARTFANAIPSQNIVTNKLKQLGAHVTAARDQWEALAALARFYPRKGIPKSYIDQLVALLETTDMRSFQQVVAQSLIFYEARQSK